MATTLEQLRLRALNRIEFVTGSSGLGYVSRDELTDYVNESGRELHGELVSQYGEDWFTGATPTEFTLTSSSNTYDFPSDCLKHQLFERYDGGEWIPCRRTNWSDRTAWTSSRARSLREGPRYHLAGNTVVFVPESEAAGTYRVWYARCWTDMTGSNDTLPLQMEPFAEFIVADVAAKCRDKEGTNADMLLQQKARVLQRIKSEAPNRDMGEVETLGGASDDEGDWWWR